ncbi:MAG: hypothetical protein HZA54_08950 [Planctomycetes bacterium]|nr:hypothetical protein [Planctomycetota bacterium]
MRCEILYERSSGRIVGLRQCAAAEEVLVPTSDQDKMLAEFDPGRKPLSAFRVNPVEGKILENPDFSPPARLVLTCDAPGKHPVDGVPEIRADGKSFTSILVQKVDLDGNALASDADHDRMYLRTDGGLLTDAEGKQIWMVQLKNGAARVRLVSGRESRVAVVRVFNENTYLIPGQLAVEFV